VTTDQHCKHENSDIVVGFFFGVAETFSVDKDQVDSPAIGCLDRNGLVPNPKTLSASGGLVAYYKTTWSTDQVIKYKRLATTILASDSYN
jgi:hypothetical protein